jgi:hypothetical protein
LFLDYFSAGSVIEDADLGYAENPLFLFWPDSLTTVRNTRIHHFAETGLWIHGAAGTGAVVESLIVERGVGLANHLGTEGIFLDKADEVDVLDNWVILGAPPLANADGGTGIHVVYGKTTCEETPTDAQSLLIQGNFVMGPGQDVTTGDYSGIKLEWVCGASNRTVTVKENFVELWDFGGLHFDRAADVQVSCNKADSCARGVEVYEYTPDFSGPPLRFWENDLSVPWADSTYYALRTNSLSYVALGPFSENATGDNRLRVNPFNDWTSFIVETDTTAQFNGLNATKNYWYVNDGSTDSLLSTAASIKAHINQHPSIHQVNVASFRTTDDDHECDLPERPQGAPDPPGAAALPSLVAGELQDGDRAGPPVRTLPTEISLGLAVPNPTRGRTEFLLAVPSDRTGDYGFDVFDVRGRRVFTFSKRVTSPGWYPLVWPGRDVEGLRVSAGNYFLRVKGPGFTETRRVTIVR